jgi:hypothetical protein
MQIAASKFLRPAAPAKRDIILGLLLTGMVNFNWKAPPPEPTNRSSKCNPADFGEFQQILTSSGELFVRSPVY